MTPNVVASETIAPGGEHPTTLDKHGFEVPRETTRLDFEVVRRCYLIAKPFWLSRDGIKAWAVMALTLAVTVLQTATTKWQLDLNANTTNELIARHAAAFWHYFWLGTWVGVGWTLLGMVQSPLMGLMFLWWRRSLTKDVLDKYLAHRAYYRIDQQKSVDNPDQRISDDVNQVTQAIFSVYYWVSGIISNFVIYVPLVWHQAGPRIFLILAGSGLITIVFPRMFSYLVRYNNVALKTEADFRFGLVRFRESAEPIAFYRGEEAEKVGLLKRLDRIIRINVFLIVQNVYVNFASSVYYTVAGLLPTLLLYPLFLANQMSYGYLLNVTSMGGTIQGQFAIGISIFSEWLNIAVVVNRLWNLLQKSEPEEHLPAEHIAIESGDRIAASHLSVKTPDGRRLLIADLSFSLEPGKAMLVSGPSGTGKSSLLRTLAGLWRRGSGVIIRPPERDLAFLPQSPYVTLGTLREQLLYPSYDRALSDDELHETLARVGLEALLSRFSLTETTDWQTVLSPGERQRIAFARLFLSRAKFAIIDEATSALDEAMEQKLFEDLRRTGLGFISVAHREAVVKYHDMSLLLRPNTTWELSDRR